MKMAAASVALSAMPGCGHLVPASTRSRPNVVFILADDIGYGDLGCYGATKVRTPNLDRLAAEGLRFTDGHAPAATCTPTRYAILTGEYAWRKRGTNILPGNAPLIIEPGRETLPMHFKQAGYRTGAIGKWHLGLGSGGPTDYNGEIRPGPLEIGFDTCFIIPATGDRTPCVYVKDHRVVGLDPADPITLDYGIERGAPGSFINGIPRIGQQHGGTSAIWQDEEIADTLTAKAVEFIRESMDRPFFLYFTPHDIHVPRVPHPRFAGTSGAGVRGDVIQQFDWTVGQVMEALDQMGLTENTILVVTSDNGGALDSNGPDKVHGGTVETNNGHRYNGVLRGTKGDAYEGGTRVPFIVRWPGHVKPGVSDELVCSIDMLATAASLTGRALGPGAAPDSVDILPALLGTTGGRSCRAFLVEQGFDIALRHGRWKYIPPHEERTRGEGRGSTIGTPGELYNLDEDIGETNNLAASLPDIVHSMASTLTEIRQGSRTRP